ncbi:IS110 family transposase [Methylomonas sp. LW13]|uniref:IS110 family transposase n=1 Tax=unclassified Methylomonas TaxID=2608980 RepID=UPI00051C2347|nr:MULTISPECIES: IS110 family transposase [unclassified Methylomonas]PKD39629.1 IS110 family transposase [Methylomonas sp. Kb3]QBC27724.1 IS110 family transposase [Methylomonas sp. LW13]
MKSPTNQPFTAFIGIDWADRKHDVCVQPADCERREFLVIPHKVEMINDWVQSLIQRFGSPIAVAVELSKGPIVSALQKFDCFVIYPINPSTLAKYRQAFTPSRAKDDPTDAEFAVDLLLRHSGRFKPLQPQSIEIRALSSLVEQRRSLVNDKIRITNRLRSAFKQYYPQVLDWFDHIDTPLFCDFIRHWPTLTQVKRARKNTLETFFNQHNMRFAQLLADRVEAIKTATPLTSDDAIIIPYRLQALVLIEQLSVTLEGIKQFDQEIENIARKHSDYPLFSALPGAGPSLAPRLLVAFGEQRERYPSAADLQKYAGVAPVTERSGKKHWVHWRWQCPTFLRQTFTEWAAQTINKSFWAGQYYQQQRAKGCTYQAAVRALAFKWIRILYRCWQTGKPYNESTYLKALEHRGSPLLKQA